MEGIEFTDENPLGGYGTIEIDFLNKVVKELEKRKKGYAVIPKEHPKFKEILSQIPEREYNGSVYKSYSAVKLGNGWKLTAKKEDKAPVKLVIYKKKK